MGHEGMMRRGDSDRMGRDDREMGRGWRMHRDRETGRDGDYADRDRDDRGYSDRDRPRRRGKVCVEYENGDEYCRYRQ
jgi:hypothetical protein